jgi:hypothetical protein
MAVPLGNTSKALYLATQVTAQVKGAIFVSPMEHLANSLPDCKLGEALLRTCVHYQHYWQDCQGRDIELRCFRDSDGHM